MTVILQWHTCTLEEKDLKKNMGRTELIFFLDFNEKRTQWLKYAYIFSYVYLSHFLSTDVNMSTFTFCPVY